MISLLIITIVKQRALISDYISVLNVSMSYEYMEKTYNSCSGVVMPQSGNLAMDVLCGSYGAAECTPER